MEKDDPDSVLWEIARKANDYLNKDNPDREQVRADLSNHLKCVNLNEKKCVLWEIACKVDRLLKEENGDNEKTRYELLNCLKYVNLKDEKLDEWPKYEKSHR